MTFDDLVAKYRKELEYLAQGVETGDRTFDNVVEEVMDSLAGILPKDRLRQAAEMLVNDLISRVQFPEDGPSLDGSFGGWEGSDNPDIEYGADEPAPEPVQVSVPPREIKP